MASNVALTSLNSTQFATTNSTAASPSNETLTSSNSTQLATKNSTAASTPKKNKNSCKVDKDCFDYPYYKCGVKTPNVCSHKKVFPPTRVEVAGWIVFAVFKTLSNIAGVGGGVISTLFDISFFHLTTKPAVAVSSFTIMVTTLA